MKSKIYLTAVAAMLLLTACDTELVPKGKTTLQKTEDLNYLLNNPSIKNKPDLDISIIVNESYGGDFKSNVIQAINQGNSLRTAYIAYDESIDRANLTASDTRYNSIYSFINNLNVVIGKIDDSDGNAALKYRVKAEAKILRGYYHFIAAGIYARQYDEATASSEGGIAYVTDYSTETVNRQLTLDKVYANILADMSDENIEALPDIASAIRCTRATGYAMKARVLFQMKQYTSALPYALKAIELNSEIEDRTTVLTTREWKLNADVPNNYIYLPAQGFKGPTPALELLSLETVATFEEGDIVLNYADKNSRPYWNARYGESDSGVKGCLEGYSWDVYVNHWGLTVERIMYLAAECLIRTGNISDGLDYVNRVRKYRISPDVYRDFSATDESEAMELLQKAKFIECIGSYDNYFDRKRWNTEDKYKKTIVRTIPDKGTYSITPESPLWVQPFSVEVMTYNPTFHQNY